MAVAHTTLLQYLGKNITYDVAVDQSFDPSGFVEESGFVTAVLFDLHSDHMLSVKFDDFDSYDDLKFSEIKIKLCL